MPKPIVFIAALLLALPAFAQTRMPAHQVEADTNMVNIAVSLPFTAQVALDWIDANWPAFSSESWSNLDPAEDTVQSVFDWVDDNWQAELNAEGWGYLSPEAPATAQGTFDWIDAYMGINTNNWNYLAPTASTVQATFTWLDDRFFGFDPEAVGMPGSNIVGAALVSNQWTGLMPGTNIVGAALVSNQWTGLMPGTNIVGATLVSNQWTGLMPGTNIVGATLVSNQWTGLMPGTNISWFTYDGTDTWKQLNHHADRWVCTVVAGSGTNAPIFTSGSAGVWQPVDDKISFVNDRGNWYDEATHVTTLPVDGTYLFVLQASGNHCHAQAGATNSVSGTEMFQLGVGEWGTDMSASGARAAQQWLQIRSFPAGTKFKWFVRPDVALNANTSIQMAMFSVFLIAPMPD